MPRYKWNVKAQRAAAPYQGHVAGLGQRGPERHWPGPPARSPCSQAPPAQLLGPNPGLWEVDRAGAERQWGLGGPKPLGCLDAADVALASSCLGRI